jgi:hypothetical protein
VSQEVQTVADEHWTHPIINMLHNVQTELFTVYSVEHTQSPFDKVKLFALLQLVHAVKDVQTKQPV